MLIGSKGFMANHFGVRNQSHSLVPCFSFIVNNALKAFPANVCVVLPNRLHILKMDWEWTHTRK
jgi:hypothetical protein